MEFSARQIADFLGGTIEGDEEQRVTTFSKIEEAKEGSLTFLYNPKYSDFLYTTSASIVLVNNALELKGEVKSTLIRVPNAYESLAKLLTLYDQYKPKKVGIENPSYIATSAKLGEDCYVGAFAYIGENVTIGDNVKIYPNTTIADNSIVGDNTILYAGVHIYEGSKIGSNCIFHSGAVIGSDGFGFAESNAGSYAKIPQIGIVIIEDDVEIGANTTVDRSTMGSTIIKKGAKLDNLVQVAHNVTVGENTILCGQSGIAGSTKLGKNIIVGGHSGITGHIQLGDNVKIGGHSGVANNVKDGEILFGSPAFEVRKYQRSAIITRKLPEMYTKLNKLEKSVNKLLEDKENK